MVYFTYSCAFYSVEIAAEQIAGISSSQELLDMEQDEYTALRPYPCDFCSRRFRKKASLNNHMLAHQNDRPHLCKLCGARFSRRAELISHFKAHAEAQDAADAEEAAAAAASSSIKFEHQGQRQMDDHYYEQEWPLYQQQQQQEQEQVQHDQMLQQHQQLVCNSEVQFVASYTAAVAPPPAPSRGRISRLKPKEESSQFIVISDKPGPNELQDYINSEPAVQPVVPTSQPMAIDPPPPPQPNFPVLDDSKPFVCQQCGLAFARQKALVSHTKVIREDKALKSLLFYLKHVLAPSLTSLPKKSTTNCYYLVCRTTAWILPLSATSVRRCSGTTAACRTTKRRTSLRRATRSMIQPPATIAPAKRRSRRSSSTGSSTATSAAFPSIARTCCGVMPSSISSSRIIRRRQEMGAARISLLAGIMRRMPKMATAATVVIRAANHFPALRRCFPMPKFMPGFPPSSESQSWLCPAMPAK